jgi:hypothetical protein
MAGRTNSVSSDPMDAWVTQAQWQHDTLCSENDLLRQQNAKLSEQTATLSAKFQLLQQHQQQQQRQHIELQRQHSELQRQHSEMQGMILRHHYWTPQGQMSGSHSWSVTRSTSMIIEDQSVYQPHGVSPVRSGSRFTGPLSHSGSPASLPPRAVAPRLRPAPLQAQQPTSASIASGTVAPPGMAASRMIMPPLPSSVQFPSEGHTF